MSLIEIAFWTGFAIIFYAYAGYGLLLFMMIKIKRLFYNEPIIKNLQFQPTVTFIVPCFNEASIIPAKIANTQLLNYPKEKLQIIFITDGSNDGSENITSEYKNVTTLHQQQRKGKSAAENRSVKFAEGEIIVFSDANTYLPTNALQSLVQHYINPMVGAVSGEKKINQDISENAAGAGEGIYWKYESLLKKWDSELLTVVGAAGELISFRKHLFEDLEEDTILDDFILSLRIASKGYRVVYEPKALAIENSSSNTKEELKRKIRICAGGWQAMTRLTNLLNVFKHPTLTFQYISHRVLRWSLAPLALIVMLPLNIVLTKENPIYLTILQIHLLFYLAGFVGWIFENRSIRIKPLFVPYYFIMMNYAVVIGFIRFVKGKQSSAWERSERKIIIKQEQRKAA